MVACVETIAFAHALAVVRRRAAFARNPMMVVNPIDEHRWLKGFPKERSQPVDLGLRARGETSSSRALVLEGKRLVEAIHRDGAAFPPLARRRDAPVRVLAKVRVGHSPAIAGYVDQMRTDVPQVC